MKVPEGEPPVDRDIESLFDPALLKTVLGGKTFNPKKEHVNHTEYGKVVFAEKVVRASAGTIDFSGFEDLLTVDGIQRLVPALDGGDDLVGIGGPGEGLGLLVVLGDEAVDGGLEVDDGAEDAALQPPLGQLGEEALDGVEPRAGGRREVEGEALDGGRARRAPWGACGRRSCRG